MRHCLKYDVSQASAQSSVNTVYAIFLGLLGTFLVSQNLDGAGQLQGVVLQVSDQNWLPVSLMGAYYIFDWLSANVTVGHRGRINHLLLIAVLILISYLGVLVITAFAPSHVFFSLLAPYVLIVPFWDLWLRGSDFAPTGRGLAIAAIALVRIILGVFIGFRVLSFELLSTHSDHAALQGELLILLIAFVLVKILRYLTYADEAASAGRES